MNSYFILANDVLEMLDMEMKLVAFILELNDSLLMLLRDAVIDLPLYLLEVLLHLEVVLVGYAQLFLKLQFLMVLELQLMPVAIDAFFICRYFISGQC